MQAMNYSLYMRKTQITINTGYDQGFCAVAQPIDIADKYAFNLRAKECSLTSTFFCVINGVTTTTTTTTTTSTSPTPAEPTPVLEKFPCFGSDSSSRKKRSTNEESPVGKEIYLQYDEKKLNWKKIRETNKFWY